jgi:prevent-host-death family protein
MPKLREAPGYPSTGADGETPTVDRMPTISSEELIADFDAFLDRAEAGEEFTITVSGEPVATLGPARKYWVDGSTLQDLWDLPVDENLARDIAEFDIELRDPWAERE